MVLGRGTELESFSPVEGEYSWRRQMPELLTTTGIKRGEAVALGAGKVPLAAPKAPGSAERRVPLPGPGRDTHRKHCLNLEISRGVRRKRETKPVLGSDCLPG